jgi:hypothetical protein
MTHLHQVHVWHNSLDLLDDLSLGGRVNLLQLDSKDSLLLGLLLCFGKRIDQTWTPDYEHVKPTSAGASVAAAAAAPPAGADAAGIATSVIFRRVC